MATVASAAAGYVWEDPGDSIMVQISLDLVERLGAAIEQGLGTGPRGAEIGGLLLGRKLPGHGRAVSIEDFELVPCGHLRGASYTLSPGERHMLGAHLARRRIWQVVGYFRSHTRPGLYLDQDDFAVFSRYFPDPWQVFLLVRPSTEDAATGGFFFWEDGDVNRRSPYRQFPFDGKQLAAGGYPITAERSANPPAPRLAPVPAPRPAARAPRRVPPVSWLIVSAIAGLFLIAGIFVSETRDAKPAEAPAKTSPPVETLLPPAAPQVVKDSPFAEQTAPPAGTAPATVTPGPKPARRRVMQAPAASPVKAARATAHMVEPPPALTPSAGKVHSGAWALLPSHPAPPPPPEAEMSYDVPRAGVFRRALRKISGIAGTDAADEFVPPSPVHRVAPANPPDSDEEARLVDVKVSIDESGNVSRAQVLSQAGYLAVASLNAARQWRFTPARKRDKPVPSEMVLHFRFPGAAR